MKNDSQVNFNLDEFDKTKREDVMRDLKSNCNDFMWTHLPDGTTLGEADKLSSDLYSVVERAWDQEEKAD